MVEIKVTFGQDAFEHGQFVYVWFDGNLSPFYVGETGKSPIDRAGLHIRDSSRSGAIVSEIIQRKNNPCQEYLVLAFPLSADLLNGVSTENGGASSSASHNRARKAIERKVYDVLSEQFPEMHKARGCSWSAKSSTEFAQSVLATCRARAGAA